MKKLLHVFIISCIPFVSFSQEQIRNLNLHIYNPMILNPAMTGYDIKHRAIVHGRYITNENYKQLIFAASYDNYIDKINSGFGANLYTDKWKYSKTDSTFEINFAINYSYRIRLSEKQSLRLGVGVGLNNYYKTFKSYWGSYEDIDDVVVSSGRVYVNKTNLNTHLGVHYGYGKFGIGVAAFNIIGSNSDRSLLYFFNRRYFTLYTDYKFTLGKAVEYHPQLMVYAINYDYGTPINIELYNKFSFYNRFFVSPNINYDINGFGGSWISFTGGITIARYFEAMITVFNYKTPQYNSSASYRPLKSFEMMLKFKI